MIAVLYATEAEARPLLDRLRVSAVDDGPCRVFRSRAAGVSALVAISGMGMVAARAACRRLVETHGARAVLNVGVCGGLGADMRPGDIYTVGLVMVETASGAEAAATVRAEPWPDLPCARLVTVTEPLFGTERRAALAAVGDVVDMEGAAVLDECAALGVACRLIKGVSDDARDGSRAALRRNLEPVARRLAERVVRDLPRLAPMVAKPADAPGAGRGLLRRLAGFTRIEHTVFSLPLLLAGGWLGADGRLPSWRALALIAVVGVGGRTFGMAMNRILDRDLDARNPRTAGRDLPSGRLSPRQGYLVAAAGLAVYLAGCAALGPLCLTLAPLPLLPLTAYALLKRFTACCHFGIGLCLAAAPLGAFIAVSGQLPVDGAIWMLAGFAFLWIAGFDIVYALQDIEADRASGVRSIPAALGSRGAQMVAAAVHAGAFALLHGVWRATGMGMAAGVALAVAGVTMALAYSPRIPLPTRFFPLSAIASAAAAAVVIV